MIPVESTDNSFPSDVPSEGIAVVDFWAAWCGPCRQFAPVFEASARANPDVRHLKVDVDANPAVSSYFAISSIPTTVFIRDGIVVHSVSGALSGMSLASLVSEVRALDMVEVRSAADEDRISH